MGARQSSLSGDNTSRPLYFARGSMSLAVENQELLQRIASLIHVSDTNFPSELLDTSILKNPIKLFSYLDEQLCRNRLEDLFVNDLHILELILELFGAHRTPKMPTEIQSPKARWRPLATLSSIEEETSSLEESSDIMTDFENPSTTADGQNHNIDHGALLSQIKAWCNEISATSVPYSWARRRQEITQYIEQLARVQDSQENGWQSDLDELAELLYTLDRTVAGIAGLRGLGPTLEFEPPEPRETNRLPSIVLGVKLIEGAGFMEPNLQREIQKLRLDEEHLRKPDAGVLFNFPGPSSTDGAGSSSGGSDNNLIIYSKLYKKYLDNCIEVARRAETAAEKALAAYFAKNQKFLSECTVLAQDLRHANRRYPRPLMSDIVRLIQAGLRGLDVPAELEFRSEEYFAPYQDRMRVLRAEEIGLLRYLCEPNRPKVDFQGWSDAERALHRAVEELLLAKDADSSFNNGGGGWITIDELMDAVKERMKDDGVLRGISLEKVGAGVKKLADLNMLDYSMVSQGELLGVRRYQPLLFPEALLNWQSTLLPAEEESQSMSACANSLPVPASKSDGMTFLLSSEIRRRTTNFFRCLAFRLGFSLKIYQERRKEDRALVKKLASGRRHHRRAHGMSKSFSLIDVVGAMDPNLAKKVLSDNDNPHSRETSMVAQRLFLQKQLVREASYDPYLISNPAAGQGRRALQPSSASLWAWANPRGRKKRIPRRWDINRYPKEFTNAAVGVGLRTTWKTCKQREVGDLLDVDPLHLNPTMNRPLIDENVSFRHDALQRRATRDQSGFSPGNLTDTPLKKNKEKYAEGKIRKQLETTSPPPTRGSTIARLLFFSKRPPKRPCEEEEFIPSSRPPPKCASQGVHLALDHDEQSSKRRRVHYSPHAAEPASSGELRPATELKLLQTARIPGLDEQMLKREAEMTMARAHDAYANEVPALALLQSKSLEPAQERSRSNLQNELEEIASQLEEDTQMERGKQRLKITTGVDGIAQLYEGNTVYTERSRHQRSSSVDAEARIEHNAVMDHEEMSSEVSEVSQQDGDASTDEDEANNQSAELSFEDEVLLVWDDHDASKTQSMSNIVAEHDRMPTEHQVISSDDVKAPPQQRFSSEPNTSEQSLQAYVSHNEALEADVELMAHSQIDTEISTNNDALHVQPEWNSQTSEHLLKFKTLLEVSLADSPSSSMAPAQAAAQTPTPAGTSADKLAAMQLPTPDSSKHQQKQQRLGGSWPQLDTETGGSTGTAPQESPLARKGIPSLQEVSDGASPFSCRKQPRRVDCGREKRAQIFKEEEEDDDEEEGSEKDKCSASSDTSDDKSNTIDTHQGWFWIKGAWQRGRWHRPQRLGLGIELPARRSFSEPMSGESQDYQQMVYGLHAGQRQWS